MGLLDGLFQQSAPFGVATPQENAARPKSLLDNLVSGMGRGILSAITLPGEVYQGKVPVYGEDGHTSLELIGRANDMAGVLMHGAGAVPAEANALRSGMSFFDDVAKKYPGVKIDGSVPPSGYATLSRIEVPKDMRGQGIGSNVMTDLISAADAQGVPMALSPSSAFGGSKARLVEFYKRFGFSPNSGRNKDFSTRETMIRAVKGDK